MYPLPKRRRRKWMRVRKKVTRHTARALDDENIAAPAELEAETTAEDMDNDTQLYDNLTYTQRMDLFVKVGLSLSITSNE